MQSIRLMLVDDHEVVRTGLKSFLESQEGLLVIAEASSGKEALELALEHKPDVVIMDMRMEGDMDGIQATREIREMFPNIQVVALSSYYDHELVQGVIQAGAIGYLLKDGTREDLVEAVRAAHSGRSTLASEAVQALVQQADKSSSLGEDLTEQEKAVLALLEAL